MSCSTSTEKGEIHARVLTVRSPYRQTATYYEQNGMGTFESGFNVVDGESFDGDLFNLQNCAFMLELFPFASRLDIRLFRMAGTLPLLLLQSLFRLKWEESDVM